jgi:hypothetical protein
MVLFCLQVGPLIILFERSSRVRAYEYEGRLSVARFTEGSVRLKLGRGERFP